MEKTRMILLVVIAIVVAVVALGKLNNPSATGTFAYLTHARYRGAIDCWNPNPGTGAFTGFEAELCAGKYDK
jgi:hypothetical protein